jgi:hypothetical protein
LSNHNTTRDQHNGSMEDLWWINLRDERLVEVSVEDVRPGHRQTFTSVKEAAIKRLRGKGETFFELDSSEKEKTKKGQVQPQQKEEA